MKITTISEGLAKVATNGGNVIISRDYIGRWTARPEWETLIVGKNFPRFDARREAVQWAINTYGGSE